MIIATEDGAVTLFYNGASKLATSNTGVTITGIAVATSFTGNLTGNLLGTPTAPTASANTNTTQVATTAYVQTELTDLINGAPGTLDTLNELAAAINDDANYNSTLTTALATKLPLAGGTLTGNLTVPNIYVADDITHTGDANTYLSFESDLLNMYMGGTNVLGLTASGAAVTGTLGVTGATTLSAAITTNNGYVYINEDGGDYDVRVESSGNANMLFVDGGEDRVGIGTASPDTTLQVGDNGSAGGAVKIYGVTNGNPLTIYEDTDNSVTHNFHLDSSDNAGAILYANGASAKISLQTAGDSYFTGGDVGIGTTGGRIMSGYDASSTTLTIYDDS